MMRRFDGRTCRPRCTGWTMIHMAVAISLLGIFMLGASRVFMMTQGTVRKSQQGLTAIHQSQSMLGYLRTDVWSAQRMQVVGQQSLEISLPDDSVVSWKFNDASFSRGVGPPTNPMEEAEPTKPMRWSIAAERATFVVNGPLLRLQLIDANDGSMGEVRLTSHVLLAQAMHENAGEEGADQESGGAP